MFIQLLLARKSDDRFVGAAPVGQTLVYRMVIIDATLNAAGDDHGPGLAADLPLGDDLIVKVADHHVRLFGDGKRLAFHKCAEFFLRLFLVEHRVIFHDFLSR